MLKKRPVLVTGGAGFIGSNIIKKLNENGHFNILIVEDTENFCENNLQCLKFDDLVDFRDIINNLHKLSVYDIIHQGAIVDTTSKDSVKMLYHNYIWSQRLLHYSMDNNSKFIYASSASVYGHNTDKTEKPLNVYSISKYMFDKYIKYILHEHVKNIVGLRYFNVYGPGENHKGRMASVIYHTLMANKNQTKPKMFEGSDQYLRDFIYVSDVADIVYHCLTNSINSGIYDCGSGTPRSFKDAITLAADNKPITIPFPDDLKDQYQKYTCADKNDLIALKYYKSPKSLEDGIAEYKTFGV